MDAQQIVQHIDDGANFYVRLFGTAEHIADNGFYAYVKPKEGQQGISFIFNLIRIFN